MGKIACSKISKIRYIQASVIGKIYTESNC
jgi:hypothetical protein